MAITRLQVTDKLYQCLDNKTMTVVNAKGYRYKPEIGGSCFKLGNETFSLVKSYTSFYKNIVLCREFEDYSEDVVTFKSIRNSVLKGEITAVYMRVIDSFITPKKDYYSIAISGSPFEGVSSFKEDYAILVFNKHLKLVAITKILKYRDDLDQLLKIEFEWCNDTKLKTLGRFAKSIDIRHKLIEKADLMEESV